MTDRELMQQALDALESVFEGDDKGAEYWTVTGGTYEAVECMQVMRALRARLAQPKPEPVAHYVIAGALFDFMGWLTSRKERIVLSSADNASPAVEVITEFAKMRGLSLDDAKVQDWNTAPPQRKPLTSQERDAQRWRFLMENSYDSNRVTQFHVWEHSWEPHSQTGEPTEWKQRVRGIALIDFIDRAIEAAHGIKENKA
jgi:hypothetical protein